MHRPARSRPWITWLTLWALVLGACLPTLSQAVVHATERSNWVEVCTSTGMVWVRADDGGSPVSEQAGCIWCLSAHGGPALPHTPSVPSWQQPGPHACPDAPALPRVSAGHWAPALARGPPVGA